MRRFFVYELVDPRDDSVFYVGKGQGNRPQDHLKEARRGKSSEKCDRIRDIEKSGSVTIRIVARFSDEAESYDFEAKRIESIGLDNLTNVIPGGLGGRCVEQEMPTTLSDSVIKSLIHIFSLEAAGTELHFGDANLTEFAKSSLAAFAKDCGEDYLRERFAQFGVTLLTRDNNGVH